MVRDLRFIVCRDSGLRVVNVQPRRLHSAVKGYCGCIVTK